MFLPKRGQSGPSGGMAGLLILLIGFIIVLYILFLPPQDRAQLLGDSSTEVGINGPLGTKNQQNYAPTGTIIFKETPGRIDFHNKNEFLYNIPSFYLYQTVNSAVLASENPFQIRNGWFDKKDKSFFFGMKDIDLTDNIILTFENKKHQGLLRISLNGNMIYENDVGQFNVDAITLPKTLLQEQNEMKFEVSSVGGKFWTTNEYQIQNLKITGDVTDISKQQSVNTFFLESGESRNIASVSLKFLPDCTPSKVGKLNIFLNRQLVFSGVPDCGIPNTKQFSESYLEEGKNELVFVTEAGSYLIDKVQIQTKLEETKTKTYYFDVAYGYFTNVDVFLADEKCGDIDGYCPPNCDEDIDKDCCFAGDTSAFWCDVPTPDEDDRCVNFMDGDKCARCSSGYEEQDGYAAEACKTKCGDDMDGTCPAGCSPNYDADCCFLNATRNPTGYYFCYDNPSSGVDQTCQASVSYSECSICPTTFLNGADNPDADCLGRGTEPVVRTAALKQPYKAVLEIQFADDKSQKEAFIYINGRMVNIDTREAFYVRTVSDELQPGTNAIKIVPQTDLDIVKVEIRVQ